jgi:hypothetical protein
MRLRRMPVGEVRAAKCLDLLLTVLTELDVASRRCCHANALVAADKYVST